ncbi:MAG: riboflavin synthase [Leeuwenhoekiella sp.]
MFTGIIEDLGRVVTLKNDGGNLNITISSSFTSELQIDQSVAHNGACLTVVDIKDDQYTVTAIDETLQKTNLNGLYVNQQVNLERAMIMGARLDGHMVQGHVDQTGTIESIKKQNGSWIFGVSYDVAKGNLTIEKGSITINGVSLTVVASMESSFTVAIIPYTFEHTTFKDLKEGDEVNLEFDVIGKYVSKFMTLKS